MSAAAVAASVGSAAAAVGAPVTDYDAETVCGAASSGGSPKS